MSAKAAARHYETRCLWLLGQATLDEIPSGSARRHEGDPDAPVVRRPRDARRHGWSTGGRAGNGAGGFGRWRAASVRDHQIRRSRATRPATAPANIRANAAPCSRQFLHHGPGGHPAFRAVPLCRAVVRARLVKQLAGRSKNTTPRRSGARATIPLNSKLVFVASPGDVEADGPRVLTVGRPRRAPMVLALSAVQPTLFVPLRWASTVARGRGLVVARAGGRRTIVELRARHRQRIAGSCGVHAHGLAGDRTSAARSKRPTCATWTAM